MLITSAAVPLSAIQVAEVKSREIIIVSSIGVLSHPIDCCCPPYSLIVARGAPTISPLLLSVADPMAMRALPSPLLLSVVLDPWLCGPTIYLSTLCCFRPHGHDPTIYLSLSVVLDPMAESPTIYLYYSSVVLDPIRRALLSTSLLLSVVLDPMAMRALLSTLSTTSLDRASDQTGRKPQVLSAPESVVVW
jgi:hypothetical protein